MELFNVCTLTEQEATQDAIIASQLIDRSTVTPVLEAAHTRHARRLFEYGMQRVARDFSGLPAEKSFQVCRRTVG